jgi:EAL domain-containing protein (putative c-di-GMP-specific phosphodiesterase class I)
MLAVEGMRAIAEGVSNSVTSGLLRPMGCDEAQGFHFERSMPAGQAVQWLTMPRHPLDNNRRSIGPWT